MSNILYEYDGAATLAYIAEEQYGLGHSDGVGIGEVSKVILLMLKKVQKFKTLEVIADELECTTEEIRHLYETIIQCGPECSVEDILERVTKSS